MNNPYIQNEDLKRAGERAQKAATDFNEVQKYANEQRIKAIEKLAYFAAGTISLSITFLGYLLSQDFYLILQETFLGRPIIMCLFISWGLFVLAILASLSARFYNTAYLPMNSAHNWASMNKELKEKMINYLKAGAPVAFIDADTPEEGEKNLQESKEGYEELEEESSSKAKRYIWLTNISREIAICSTVVGLIVLLIFVIKVSSMIIF